MDVKINIEHLEEDIQNGNIKVNNVTFKKMLFLYNALEDGWSIKKKDDTYVFSKNPAGKKEVLEESYLLKFMKNNFDIKKIIS
jgi:hypothetical protein